MRRPGVGDRSATREQIVHRGHVGDVRRHAFDHIESRLISRGQPTQQTGRQTVASVLRSNDEVHDATRQHDLLVDTGRVDENSRRHVHAETGYVDTKVNVQVRSETARVDDHGTQSADAQQRLLVGCDADVGSNQQAGRGEQLEASPVNLQEEHAQHLRDGRVSALDDQVAGDFNIDHEFVESKHHGIGRIARVDSVTAGVRVAVAIRERAVLEVDDGKVVQTHADIHSSRERGIGLNEIDANRLDRFDREVQREVRGGIQEVRQGQAQEDADVQIVEGDALRCCLHFARQRVALGIDVDLLVVVAVEEIRAVPTDEAKHVGSTDGHRAHGVLRFAVRAADDRDVFLHRPQFECKVAHERHDAEHIEFDEPLGSDQRRTHIQIDGNATGEDFVPQRINLLVAIHVSLFDSVQRGARAAQQLRGLVQFDQAVVVRVQNRQQVVVPGNRRVARGHTRQRCES